jgi:hypothetical protein
MPPASGTPAPAVVDLTTNTAPVGGWLFTAMTGSRSSSTTPHGRAAALALSGCHYPRPVLVADTYPLRRGRVTAPAVIDVRPLEEHVEAMTVRGQRLRVDARLRRGHVLGRLRRRHGRRPAVRVTSPEPLLLTVEQLFAHLHKDLRRGGRDTRATAWSSRRHVRTAAAARRWQARDERRPGPRRAPTCSGWQPAAAGRAALRGCHRSCSRMRGLSAKSRGSAGRCVRPATCRGRRRVRTAAALPADGRPRRALHPVDRARRRRSPHRPHRGVLRAVRDRRMAGHAVSARCRCDLLRVHDGPRPVQARRHDGRRRRRRRPVQAARADRRDRTGRVRVVLHRPQGVAAIVRTARSRPRRQTSRGWSARSPSRRRSAATASGCCPR